jgi:hypothetical protein
METNFSSSQIVAAADPISFVSEKQRNFFFHLLGNIFVLKG